MTPTHLRTAANLDPELKTVLDSLVDYHTDRIWLEQDRRARKLLEKNSDKNFSLARTILAMSREQFSGPSYDFLENCAALAGVRDYFDKQRVVLPFQILKRDLTVAVASGAGYLVATSYGATADILRGFSVAASAGVTFVGSLQGNLAIPRVTTAPSTHALPTEGTSITESTPVIGQVAMTPKSLACFVEFSRQLLLQADADNFVRMIMLSALGQFLDKQILQGTGAAGELLGLFNTSGLQTQSGTTLGHAGTTTMKKLASEAGALDADIGFLSTPAVRQLLEVREKATGNGGFVWEKDAVADCRAFASNDCPTASMVAGPWSQVVVSQWGPPGIKLEVNPYAQTKFQQGIIQARMVIDCDMGVIRPTAFVKSETIT